MPVLEVSDMPSLLATTLIEIYSRNWKRTPPWRLANFFSPRNWSCPYTPKNFWQSTWYFLSLHTFSGKQQSQQLSSLATNTSHVFFQTKAIPPALWNACDYVLQFNLEIAHIAGSVNTAADFLSRLQLKVRGKIRLKIR